MGLLSLCSLTLFVVPVFVTFGIYFAADYQNILSCGFSCGQPGGSNGALPGIPVDLVGHTFCELSYPIIPTPGDYILNPNQWGNPDANEGSLCIKITGDDMPEGYSNSWQSEWSFRTPGPTNRPVHAFPNAAMNEDQLPVQISDMSGLSVDVTWNYQTAAADLNANVCVDMFFSHSSDSSSDTENADFEVMVWLGQYGGAYPLGYDEAVVDTRIVDGTTFSLYSGPNQFGQLTFTWLASGNTETFRGDIGPLLTGLGQYQGPTEADYLGYLAFGSEVFYASENATFSVPKLDLNVQK